MKKKDLIRFELCLELAKLIRDFQLKNRFVGSAYGFSYSPAEAHLLGDVSRSGIITSTQLCAQLCLHKVYVSRMIAGLVKKGSIQISVDESDRRRKVIRVTRKGEKELRELTSQIDPLFRAGVERLSEEEGKLFLHYLTIFADGLNAPELPRRETFTTTTQITRITRALGLLGPDIFFFGKLTTLEWFILTELDKCREPLCATDFVRLFTSHANTISDALRQLKRRMFVSVVKRSDTADKRKHLVSLKLEGRKLVEELYRKLTVRLIAATSELTEKELSELNRLTSSFVRPRVVEKIISPRISFKEFTSPEDLNRLRRFYVECRIEKRDLDAFPESFFCATSINFAILQEDTIIMAAEIGQFAERDFVIRNVTASGSSPSRETLRAFLGHVKSAFFSKKRGARLFMEETVEDLSGLRTKRHGVRVEILNEN